MNQPDPLESLLSEAAIELENIENKNKRLTETDLFQCESNQPQQKQDTLGPSVVHTGDTDSSDDEDNRNYESRKYNDSGNAIKQLLNCENTRTTNAIKSCGSVNDSTWKNNVNKPRTAVSTTKTTLEKPQDVFIDPIFHMRIVNPLISASVLKDRMVGREAISFSRLAMFVQLKDNIKEKDWVICGVLVNKSATRTSQNGNQYSIWTLSDLKDDIKTVSLFLFKGSYSDHKTTSAGSVLGVLNPNVLDKKDGSKDVATLSVDNAQKVMIFGQSKDFGTCKSVKKNGEKCTAIVNLSKCEFCVYHIRKEYQKCTVRSELQANFAGRGLTALRNKVLGKNEVFYAGKSYTAIPAKKSKKLEQRDQHLLQSLNNKQKIQNNIGSNIINQPVAVRKENASSLDVSQAQRIRDLELLKKLGGTTSADLSTNLNINKQHSAEVSLEESKTNALNVINKLKEKHKSMPKESLNIPEKINLIDGTESQHKSLDIFCNKAPKLSGENSFIDLNKPFVSKRAVIAKQNAIDLIQKKGPIKKIDPNSSKTPSSGVKRLLPEGDKSEELTMVVKKSKLQESEFISDRFKKMMAVTSKHTNLLEIHDEEEKEKYFYKLEAKERMEEKMQTTYKVPCKAVRCLKCKYTSFSASDLCKAEKHPLKVFDAMKRFFKCGNCQNRTVSLDVIPTFGCKNCGSGKWERTGMMKEKTVAVQHNLSIRGGEQKHVNSVASDANINLLVPEDGA